MCADFPKDAGAVVWVDLTVENAEEVRDFYKEVVGWQVQPVPMGDYEDYSMMTSSGAPAAGVCHARGVNADLPPQWLLYVTVADLDSSVAACERQGGKVVAGPRSMGPYGRFCVVQDPAGASCALIEPAAETADEPSVERSR